MRAMTFPRGSWLFLSIFTSFLLTAAARPLSPGNPVPVDAVSVNAPVVQDVDINAVIEELIDGLGLQQRKFSFVKNIAVNLGFPVGKGFESVEEAGKVAKTRRFHPTASEDEFLAQARSVSSRTLLQTGGPSQQQQPGNGGRYVTDNMLGDSLLSILLALGFCVVLFFVMLTRRFCMSRRRRQRRGLGDPPPRNQEAPSAALPHSILKGLPIVSFKKEGENQTFNQGNGENQCPICLIEFEPKDSLRKLPECSHYFHQSCVDEWFKRNHTCPLCRTSLLPSEPSSAAATAADGASSHAQTEVAAPWGGEAAVPVADLEQEAGQAAPCPAPLEREGPGARP